MLDLPAYYLTSLFGRWPLVPEETWSKVSQRGSFQVRFFFLRVREEGGGGRSISPELFIPITGEQAFDAATFFFLHFSSFPSLSVCLCEMLLSNALSTSQVMDMAGAWHPISAADLPYSQRINFFSSVLSAFLIAPQPPVIDVINSVFKRVAAKFIDDPSISQGIPEWETEMDLFEWTNSRKSAIAEQTTRPRIIGIQLRATVSRITPLCSLFSPVESTCDNNLERSPHGRIRQTKIPITEQPARTEAERKS